MMDKTANRPAVARPAFWLGAVLLAAALGANRASAQELDPVELEELVAPIALYPDDVLGIVLPAATFPLDIVRAARFLDDLELDPTLEPDPAWDDSIVALLNYPEVLRMMNEDLDWTWALGEAVLTDQVAVLEAAQQFRSRAYAAGNLRSDDKQIVGYSDGAIQIKPAKPDVVYIPVYEPRQVVIYNAVPYYSYYPIGYPLYYYPYPAGYSFGLGYFWGVTSYFSIGWHSHYVHVLHHSHRLHPYYLNSYYVYSPFYARTHVNVTVHVDNYTNVWTPGPRQGSRPRTITTESRTSAVRPRSVTTESQPGLGTRSDTVSSSVSSASRRTTTTQRPTSSLGSSLGSRSTSSESTRTATSRSVSPTPGIGTQTRSVPNRDSAGAAAGVSSLPSTSQPGAASESIQTTAPATRRSAITRPTQRPQVSTPSATVTTPSAPITSAPQARSTQSTTRRSSPSPAPLVTAPPTRSAAPAARPTMPSTRSVAPAASPSSSAIGGSSRAPSSRGAPASSGAPASNGAPASRTRR